MKLNLAGCEAGVKPAPPATGSSLTLAQYADAKRLSIEFLRGLGLADVRSGNGASKS